MNIMEYSWLVVAVLLVVVLFMSRSKAAPPIIRNVHRDVPQYVEVKLMNSYFSMPIATYRDIFNVYIAETTSFKSIIKVTHVITGQSVTLPIQINEFIERSQNYDPNLLTQLGEAGIDYSLIFRAIKHSQL